MTKIFAALLLALCLMLGTAQASGLDEALSGYIDFNDQVRWAMSAQIDTLLPYGEETIAMFNGVLKHLSVSAEISEGETVMEIGVSGDAVMEVTERETDAGFELTTPLLPNRTLQSSASILDGIGNSEEVRFDLVAAIGELEGCYQHLTEAIRPYAEEKQANYTIKSVGGSKWTRLARLTLEQGVELSPLIEQVLACGMDESYRALLKGLTPTKNFVIALYQTKEGGQDLALYMKGYVTLADGITRKLAYQWAFTVKNGVRIDTFKYEMVRSKTAASTREIHADLKRRADEQLVVDGECELIDKDGGVTTTAIQTYDLSGKASGTTRTIEGTVTLLDRVKEGETTTTDTLTLTPNMKLTSQDGSGVLSGTVQLEQKTSKVVNTALTLLFDEQPAQLLEESPGIVFAVVPDAPQSSLSQNPEKPQDYLVGEPPIGIQRYDAPETMQVINLDQQPDTTALMDELTQNLAGKLLIALSKMPEEDIALLRDNMTEADYAAFLAMADGL